ncbi:MAG: hypothetical protein M3297_08970 [Thermoproteota archaeon]|nr:hypothetical protein [Thermoproteota archaeon]
MPGNKATKVLINSIKIKRRAKAQDAAMERIRALGRAVKLVTYCAIDSLALATSNDIELYLGMRGNFSVGINP